MMTPVAIVFWFGLSTLFIFASLWLDKPMPVNISIPQPANIVLTVVLLVSGSTLTLMTVYDFIKARGSPVPFNPPRELVTTRLNSKIRNPMVLGWFIMLFGLGILLNSFSLIVIFTPLFILLNVLYLKTIEEREMEKKFGVAYLEYKRRVPMFILGLGKRN